MKVFVSSLISGLEPYRAAVRRAVETLRHEAVVAEDFAAAPHSPQVACLQALRGADIVVLVLGADYGAQQGGSGLSATHEEYRDARGRQPVIAFVQQGVAPDGAQAAFIAEVQGWEGGLFRGGFADPAELEAGVIRALHDYELSKVVAPLDAPALNRRAEQLVESSRSGWGGYREAPTLRLAVAGGPMQKILRPVQMESAELRDHFHKVGLFGDARIFDGSKGLTADIRQGGLVLEQERGASFQLNGDGSIVMSLPVADISDASGKFSVFPAIIEEVVQHQVATGLAFAGAVLEHVDPTQRLTHIAVSARLEGSDYLGWRTRAEQNASGNSGVVHMGSANARSSVTVTQPRAALRLNTRSMVEDLIVPLRRQWRSR